MRKGPDTSHHQKLPKLVPWHEADFGAVRVSWGTSLDELADEHLRCAVAAGVTDLLAYHWINLSAPPEAQAAHFLAAVHRLEDAEHVYPLGLALDVEDPPASLGPPFPRPAYSTAINRFGEYIAAHSTRPLALYGSPDFIDSLTLSERFRAWPLWIAHHTDKPAPRLPKHWRSWAIWQHAVEPVPGTSMQLDRNRHAGTAEDWRRTFGPRPTHDELGGIVTTTQRASGHGPGGVEDFQNTEPTIDTGDA
jgi:GH25 family lysozyme M1 (1,4-beta-N-acetylmuramidase)